MRHGLIRFKDRRKRSETELQPGTSKTGASPRISSFELFSLRLVCGRSESVGQLFQSRQGRRRVAGRRKPPDTSGPTPHPSRPSRAPEGRGIRRAGAHEGGICGSALCLQQSDRPVPERQVCMSCEQRDVGLQQPVAPPRASRIVPPRPTLQFL
jgi:hypothetical protein